MKIKKSFFRLSGAAALLLLLAAGAASSTPFFAAPYTGEKVENYRVELPVSRDDRQNFDIPKDCDAAIRQLNQGAAQWGTHVERQVWFKTGNDCHYYSLLNRFDNEVDTDFVSDYDFCSQFTCSDCGH